MSQEEKMKLFSYDEAISALKIYRDLTNQVLPAVYFRDQKTISDFNKLITNKLARIDAITTSSK